MDIHPATLVLGKLRCIHESSGLGSDDVYIKIYVDGNYTQRWPSSGHHDMDSGDNDYLDLEIDVTYSNEVRVEVWDEDPKESNHDLLARMYIERGDALEGELRDGRGDDADYSLTYRIIKDPIPTLRVLGIKCQKPSLGIDMELVEGITSSLEECADAAGDVLKKIPRPTAQIMAKGFKAAEEVLERIAGFIEWIAEHVDNPDEVYMKHVDPSRGIDGSFFPPEGGSEQYRPMRENDEIHFEDTYGKYFRFPLDRGDVTIQLREMDPVKQDISLGSLTIQEADYERLTEQGAQVMVANEYYPGDPGAGREGEGAVYHICYSVGLEDWAKDATTAAQEAA